MSSKNTTITEWENMRTNETRQLEIFLIKRGFEKVDAYRYNSASIRLRINDSRFKGLTHEQRDDLVEPFLSQVEENTQADIMNLTLLYPGEIHNSFQVNINNEEFEHPSQSML